MDIKLSALPTTEITSHCMNLNDNDVILIEKILSPTGLGFILL